MYLGFKSYIQINFIAILYLNLIDKYLSVSQTTTCSPGFYFDTTLVDCTACRLNSSNDATNSN